jgi:hypothetical protein
MEGPHERAIGRILSAIQETALSGWLGRSHPADLGDSPVPRGTSKSSGRLVYGFVSPSKPFVGGVAVVILTDVLFGFFFVLFS